MPTISLREPNFVLAHERNLAIAAWTGPPRPGQMLKILALTHQLAKERGTKIALLDVIVDGRPAFDDHTRTEGARVVRESASHGACTAHVVLLDGLGGVAVRAFLSTMTLLGRSVVPTRVFGEVAPALAWMAPLISAHEPWSVEQLQAACEAATRR